jgi:hypothetical protein
MDVREIDCQCEGWIEVTESCSTMAGYDKSIELLAFATRELYFPYSTK